MIDSAFLAAGCGHLLQAQQRAKDLFAAVSAQGLIQPGQTEQQVSDAIFDLARAQFGIEKFWHKRIVRAGENTLLPYQHNPPNRVIEADDIVFLDFGPIFEDYEADFGYTVVLGDDPVKHRLKADTESLFQQVKLAYLQYPAMTGRDLYTHVVAEAAKLGWGFGNTHCGHIVGKFPHERRLGDDRSLYLCEENPMPLNAPINGQTQHWILEIHLIDTQQRIGGFFEDILTV